MFSRSDSTNSNSQEQEILKTAIQQFSQIFEQNSQKDDPHFTPAKNNILIILLCFTVYSIYQLFFDYIDAILLAFLSGVAYRQLKDRFIKLWIKDPNFKRQINGATISIIVIYSILFIFLPWIRYQSKNQFLQIDFSPEAVWSSFIKSTNVAVRIAQTYLFLQISYFLFGNKLDEWFTFKRLQKRGEKICTVIFAIITFIVVIFMITTVVVVLTVQSSKAFNFTKKSIQNFYSCQFEPSQLNNTIIPCSQKISGNLSVYMPKIQKNRTEYEICIKYIKQTQMNYIGVDYFDYEDNLCAFYQYAKFFSPNILERVSLKQTGQILGAVKNFLVVVINFILDLSFSLSTFIAIFMITVKKFESTKEHLYIFGKTKADLVNNITNVISATIFIALEHLAMAVFVFEIFRFTEINVMLSIFLSIIAFIPLVKPSIVVFLIAGFKIWMSGFCWTPIVCALLYWHYSGVIYEKYYAKVSLHIVIINLSVIFGIYQYGVSGIFYGPIIILLFQCVYEEIFRRK